MKQTVDLTPLAPDYEIVGQLDDAEDARTYIATRKGDAAKRRDDQTKVLITVVSTPEGDEANALTLLAADTKLLAGTQHRRLVPVLDGRWLGDDAFAVVTQRVSDPSLAQRIASGETFTNPRVAAILREVNGLLEWAREQKIVHRGLSAERIYLEPRTDRVRVSFTIEPIKRLHRSDALDDARAIARLAMAMLTGHLDPADYEGQTLAELRPDLPEKLGEATAAVAAETKNGEAPDVAAYIALIGMADPVAAGEHERERIRAEILEEQRAEREKITDERAAFEKMMAEQKAAFEKEITEERSKFERTVAAETEKLAKDRAALEFAVAKERATLEAAVTKERDALQKAALKEREQITAMREKLEKTVADQRAELEKAAERDRRQIDTLRETIRRVGEREVERKRASSLEELEDGQNALDAEELLPSPFIAPNMAPLEPLTFTDDTPILGEDEIVFAPSRIQEELDAAEDESTEVMEEKVTGVPREVRNRRKWILTGAAAGVLVLVGITASVLGGRSTPAPGIRTTTSAATIVPVPLAKAPVTQPAQPAVAPVATTPAPATAAPATTATTTTPLSTDSSSLRAAKRWLDSLKDRHPVEIPRAARVVAEPSPARAADRQADRQADRPSDRPANSAGDAAAPQPRPSPAMVNDPFFIPGSSTTKRDTVVRTRTDTVTTP